MEGRKDTALGLGERLRSARKARALTLEQAAHALHLEEGILAALEEERFSALGAPVFVRGHLRSYARLLELSEAAVLDAYRAADPSAQALPRVARKLEAPVRQSPGPWVIAAFIVLLLFAVVLTYVSQDEPPPGATALPPVATEPAPLSPASDLPPGLTPAPVQAPLPAEMSPEIPPAVPAPETGGAAPGPVPGDVPVAPPAEAGAAPMAPTTATPTATTPSTGEPGPDAVTGAPATREQVL